MTFYILVGIASGIMLVMIDALRAKVEEMEERIDVLRGVAELQQQAVGLIVNAIVDETKEEAIKLKKELDKVK